MTVTSTRTSTRTIIIAVIGTTIITCTSKSTSTTTMTRSIITTIAITGTITVISCPSLPFPRLCRRCCLARTRLQDPTVATIGLKVDKQRIVRHL